MNTYSELHELANTVRLESAAPLSDRSKAVQPEWAGSCARDVARQALPLLTTSTPMMTLDASATAGNIETMAQWCSLHNVQLAPHGKTTMSPALWLAQLDAGAWGITVANEAQLRVARSVGVKRVQLANLLVRPEGIRWLSNALDGDDSFEAYVWVDSVSAVQEMNRALEGMKIRRTIKVLIEVGATSARTGARTFSSAMDAAKAVLKSSNLTLAGVSGYEGVITHGTTTEDIELVDDFLRSMVRLHDELLPSFEVDDVILTAGGSAYFDRVVDILGTRINTPESQGRWVTVIVRAGAYITHDDGIYAKITPSLTRNGPRFRAAMNVWARVISIPEPGIAYLDAGRRDVPADEGFPVALDARRRDGANVHIIPTTGCVVTNMNDQHLHIALPTNCHLKVGDVVRLGISHPCTTFDKWTHVAIVDRAEAASPKIVDLIRTYF